MTTFKTILSSGLLLCSASLLCAGQASATDQAILKSFTFDATDPEQAIHVTSTDGKTWNRIKTGSLAFRASFNVDTRYRGYVSQMGLVLGQCGGNACFSFPHLWEKRYNTRDVSDSAFTHFDPSDIPLPSAGGIPIMPEGGQMIGRCNEHLAADGPTKKHEFLQGIPITLLLDTDKITNLGKIPLEAGDTPFPDDIDYWRNHTLQVKVVCDPVIKSPTDDLASPMPDFKPTDVKLFLATINGPNTDGPNPATTCPALRVTTRVQTTKAGGVDVKLWRQKGNGPITSEFKSAWASFDAEKNGFFADFVRVEKFDATTHLQFMAEVVGGTFAPSTPWKDITVHCTGAGGGGLANDMPNTGEDKPKASWTGSVTLADSAGAKKRCPRKGQAVFEVKRSEPGQFKYKLSCSNGQGFGGTVASFNKGNGVFEAFGAHDLNINRTRTVQCTLQEVKASGKRVTIDKGSFDYTCNNPAVDPQADDLATPQTPPKPTHNTQDKPGVSILCKPGFKLVGKACVKKPEVSILCKKGFMLVGKACVKKPEVSILCVKGFKPVNGKCVKTPVVVDPKKRPARPARVQMSN